VKKLNWFLTGLLIAASLVASIVVYVNRAEWLPEQVPVHWGISMEPDRWEARDNMFWYLMAVPLATMGITALIAVLMQWCSPKGYEATKSNPQLSSFVILIIAGLMTGMHAVILTAYISKHAPLVEGIMAMLFLFFIVLGNVMGKLERNFWLGIRTPWTLANHQVWEKTHRLGAWMFVAAGIIGLLSLLLVKVVPMAVLIGVWIGLLTVAALVPVVYSLVYYKQLERSGRLEATA
jgi:uncharacterized membrane protein